MTFVSYPRTTHIRGSKFQDGDHDLKAVSWSHLKGKHLVVEEKVDGGNFGISFSDAGEMQLQSRGHYLRGGHKEKQFSPLKQWASRWEVELYNCLGDRYVMFGEAMYAKHTCFYDTLPHYFMEFDLYDKVTERFLSTQRRMQHYVDAGVSDVITSVFVISERSFNDMKELTSLLTRSRFKSDNCLANLRLSATKSGIDPDVAEQTTDTSLDMEGLYVKVEDDNYVLSRHKYVRSSFTNHILDQNEHWVNRPIVPNILSPEGQKRVFTD